MDVRPKAGTVAQGMDIQCGKLLGQGAFGAVYECRGDSSLAIKKIPHDLKNYAAIHAAVNEIVISRKLLHDRIVQYIKCRAVHNHIYIVMERMPGGSLRDQLSQNGAFDEKRSRRYTSQVLDGLEYLHEEKIVHGDVKCAHVLLDAFDDIKLCDFGIATRLEEASTKVTTEAKGTSGTLHFSAPEVVNGKGRGRKSDIWSLGCTVVEMLTTQPSWPELGEMSASLKTASGKKPKYDLPATTTPAARDFLKLCFSVKPEARPTATELIQSVFIQALKVKGTELLGRGGFGRVHECRGDSSQAIKQIPIDRQDHDTIQALLSVIDVIKNLNHKRLVQYFGSYESGNHSF